MSQHSGFKFSLGQETVINASGEVGTVIARCEYIKNEPTYELRYVRSTGTATQRIWPESALSAV